MTSPTTTSGVDRVSSEVKAPHGWPQWLAVAKVYAANRASAARTAEPIA